MADGSITMPSTDTSILLRLRDGIYASDLVIVAVAWLDFFSWLSDKPSNQVEICNAFNIERRSADVMLTLFVAKDLLLCIDGDYHLTDLAREHLVKGAAWSLCPYLETMKERPTCKDLLEVLRTGKPASWGSKEGEKEWSLAIKDEDIASSFTSAMDSRGSYLAPRMAEVIDCTGYHSLLDIAGGSGIYACAITAQYNNLRASVLERPPVDDVAKLCIAKRGLSNRVSVIAGDMFGSLPDGHDIHLFSNTLHDWGQERVEALINSSYKALPPKGMIVIHDAHINENKSGPLSVAEYSVLLMYSTDGKCYSVSEINQMLTDAGFVDLSFTTTAAYWSVITGRKPA